MGEAKHIYFTCLNNKGISKIYPYESNQLRQNYGSYTEFLWHVWKRIYCYSRGNTSRGDFLILLQWNRCQGGICLVPLLFAASVFRDQPISRWSCVTGAAAHQLEHFYLGHFLYTVLIIAKLTDI